MANNPITTPLPADLPTDWVYGQTIGPNGTDVGLSQQHGYNYLMQQVNAAQQAAEEIGESFAGLAELDADGAVPPAQMPGYAVTSGVSAMGQTCPGGPLKLDNIQGNTVLGGTPAYDAPVSMESVESPLKLHVAGKNLVRPVWDIDTQTQFGVTCTRDGNSFDLAGTSSSSNGINFYIQRYDTETAFSLPAGTYTISGMPSAESLNMFLGLYHRLPGGTNEQLATDYGNPSRSKQTFTLSKATDNIFFVIAVGAGVNVDGVTITPQIEVGSEAADYEAPSNAVVEIPLIGVEGQELEPLRMSYIGRYGDGNRVEAPDRIIRKGGVWCVERNAAIADLTEATWSTSTNYLTPNLNGDLIRGRESYWVISTHFPPAGANPSTVWTAGIWMGASLAINKESLPNGTSTTPEEMAEWCAAQADAGTPVRVCYAWTEPVYEELHQDVQVLLNTLAVPGGVCSVWFEGEVLPSGADIGLPRGDFPCADVTGAYLLLNQHMQNQDNPHGVTAEQVGADAAGSAATVQTNLTNHINNKNNPHGVTPGQIGAIPSSGGSVSGPLNFANSAWNNVGDDAAFGDRNVAGNFCVKGLNGAPGITLFTSDESQSYQVFGQHNLSLLMSQLSANSVCRIASGSYVGVNTEKYNGPAKVFQLPFVPKAMIIVKRLNEESVSDINSGPKLWIAISGATYVAPTYSSGNQKGCAGFVWNGTTVTVNGYNSEYPNWNGATYDWIALG